MKKLFGIFGLVLIIGVFFRSSVFAADTVWKIMPLGDSITDGVGSSGGTGGYRDDLYNLLTQNGVNFDFVGSLNDGVSPDGDHEGHDGATSIYINNIILNKLNEFHPNYVLLHIGTNDIGSGRENAETIASIDSIVDKINNFDSQTYTLLCSITPQRDATRDQQVDDLNNRIKELVYTKLSQGFNIYYVGINEVFKTNNDWATAYLSDDGFHPNDDGYAVMAKVFLNALLNVMNRSGDIVTENFNRTSLGITWVSTNDYAISNGNLVNNDTNDDWDNLATYVAMTNPIDISVKWASSATTEGIGEAGVAVMLDAPTAQANGYLIIKRASGNLNLWTIMNGVPNSDLGNLPGNVGQIAPGDIFEVKIRTDGDGHHFDCYVNGTYDGTISDSQKLQGNSSTQYAGVILRGQYANAIDEFNIIYGVDKTPPNPITDLAVSYVQSSSVTLTWTATGDDGLDGKANSYDIRYSQEPITEANFSSATQVSNIPSPVDPGQEQTVTINGLLPVTTYYFAIKVLDEVPNVSPISNVVSATTLQSTEVVDDFERTQIGPNWVYDPEFAIVNGELANTSTEDRWDFMAVYTARKNPSEIAVKWGATADAQGINNGAITCLLDSPSPNANGYMIWRRTDIDRIYLWTVKNGAPDSLIDWAYSTLPDPGPGDEFKVVINKGENEYTFDCYINGEKDASVTGPLVPWYPTYAGVMLNGNENNNIDEFSMTVPVGDPSQVVYVSGDAQTDTVGSLLSKPLVVRLADDNGNGVSGKPIHFSVTEGTGHIEGDNGYSQYVNCGGTQYQDANGHTWAADQPYSSGGWGYVEGGGYTTSHAIANTADDALYQTERHSLSGYIFDVPNGTYQVTLKFAEIYFNHSGDRVFNVQIENQTVLENFDIYSQVGKYYALDKTFDVRVDDHHLNIDFASVNGKDPKIDAIAVRATNDIQITDASGQASVKFVLGTHGLVNKVQASYANATPFVFTLTGIPDSPQQIAYVSGNNQSDGTGGEPLAQPFVVKVMDQYGNPIPNRPVTYEVVEGGGHMQESQPVMTDPNGLASSTLILGNILAYNKVLAYTAGVQDTVVFEATAVNGIASTIQSVSGNGQSGVVGSQLQDPLVVKVVDNTGVAISNFPVNFVVTQGNGTIVQSQPIKTDSQGLASVTFILGTQAGTNTIEARATGLTGSPVVFSENGLPDVAKTLAKVSGDNQTGIVSKTLAHPFVVKVSDQYGNAVKGKPVLFTITEGGGHLSDGKTMKWDTTDVNGHASVLLTLGPLAGTKNNKVKVESNGLNGSPLYFVASATPANAAKILYVSGNNQVGFVNQTLPKSFVVKVTDASNNIVKNHPVIFKVKKGRGTFVESSDTVASVATNDNGLAQVTLKLGPTAGVNSNEVWATSSNGQSDLQGSPVKFLASSKYTGTQIAYVSGNHQSGVVMSILPQPLKVMIKDAHNNPVANQPVLFKVEGGAGKLNGSADTLIIMTNSEGIASVQLKLGPTVGQNNNIVRAYATNGYDPAPLTGSPVTFEETALGSNATQISAVSGNHQTGTVGENLPQPIKVKVMDKFGNPVKNHPVEFSVLKGGGTLGNSSDTTKTVNTNTQGIAEILWKLGPKAGSQNNRLKVSSSNGVDPLSGSPIIFIASANPGATDPDNSLIVATSPVRADGNSVSQITVTLYDRFMNPVPNKLVILEVSGSHNFINGPTSPTDANGKTTATLSSITAEKKVISAKDQTSNISLHAKAEVIFTPGQAKRMVRLSGNLQTRNVGTILAKPLEVLITDDFNNPVSGVSVTFAVKSGAGRIVEKQPVKSDTAGHASIHFILGDSPGENQIEASSAGLMGSPILFSENGVEATPVKMVYVSGNNQVGTAGKRLPHAFKVAILDANDNPVKGVDVNFRIVLGSGHMSKSPVSSNAYGIAQSYLILAPAEGSNIVNAEVEGLSGSPITFVANGVPGNASKMELVSGDHQTVRVGNVSGALLVKILDSNGNPVQGVTVHFEVEEGDATLIGDADRNSDADGLVSAAIQLGNQSGPVIVKATAEGLDGSPILFHIQAAPSAATQIVAVSPNQDVGTVGAMLPFPIQVKVLDEYQNPVPNYAITFVVTSGGGHFLESQPVTTSSNGIAECNWIMGAAPANNTAMAVASGLQGSPVTFAVQAVQNNLPAFSSHAADVTIMEKQTVHFDLEASDPDGDPLYFAMIHAPLGAQLDSISYSQREFKWTPNYNQAGQYTIIFVAYDSKGGADRDTTTITVLNKNRLPVITSFAPVHADTSITPKSSINFSLEANDPDEDVLTYFWQVNGTKQAEGKHFHYTAPASFTGSVTIIGLVTDGIDTVFHQWNISVKEKVQLESFAVNAIVRDGLAYSMVSWVTTQETDNMGFNVYRSQKRDGDYTKVNTVLIKSHDKGRYSFKDDHVKSGMRYYYKIQDVGLNGNRVLHGPVYVDVPVPLSYQISQNYPNPFNPTTTIRYSIPKAGHVELAIFNILGQKIKTLVDANKKAGFYLAHWNGRDEYGNRVSSGVYYYTITSGSYHKTRRMLLMK